MRSWSIASITAFTCARAATPCAVAALIVERSHIDEIVSILGDAIKRVA